MAAAVAERTTPRVWLALWTVYLVWGSTYLAIRVLVQPTDGEGLPPLLAAGFRFCLGGLSILTVTRRRTAEARRSSALRALPRDAGPGRGSPPLLGWHRRGV